MLTHGLQLVLGPAGHHGVASSLAEHIWEKVLCHWCRQLAPIYTCETTGHAQGPSAPVPDALPERRRNTV